MTLPFTVDHGVILKDDYFIKFDKIESINNTFSNKEIKDLMSLFLTEGIPFAFKENPLIFEEIRFWIGKKFNIDSKNISITGSSKLGFSLSPKKWGKHYINTADLDLIVVSQKIFENYKSDFKKFVSETQLKLSKKEYISKLDLENIELIKRTITKYKFIDQWKIPINKKYTHIYNSYDLLDGLLKKMTLTPNCPTPRKASLLVYEDWESCITMLKINFRSAFKNRLQ